MLCQFVRPVGDPITSPGLHFKMPFVQQVNSFDKRFLAWDGPMVEISTKDKTYIQFDTFACWRITDPMRYYLRLRDERSAESFVFWNKGHTAFIEESQKITFKDCIATSIEKAPT